MDAAVGELVGLLPDGVVVTAPDALEKYRFDWTHDATAGTPLAAVRAETAEQVQQRALASTAGAYQRNDLAGINVQ